MDLLSVSQITFIILIILIVTPLILYFNSGEYKAKKKFQEERKQKEKDTEERLAYAYFEKEEELHKRIKELEMENEMLRNSIKYGNTAFEHKQDNSLFWLVITILIGIVIFLGLKLNEQYQAYNSINELLNNFRL